MYRLINRHIKKVLDNLKHDDVSTYDWLIANRNSVAVDEYQKKYKLFWRLNAARISENYCKTYFAELNLALQKPPTLADLVLKLHKTPTYKNGRNSLQFSFATKLLHTTNLKTPIYDSLVAAFYFFEEPNYDAPLQKRVDSYISFHKFLIGEYSRILRQGLLQKSIFAFRQKFNPQYFTDEKVIDSLIWSFVALLQKGGLTDGKIMWES